MSAEVALVVLVFVLAAGAVLVATRGAQRARGAVLTALLATSGISAIAIHPRAATERHPARPKEPRTSMYVGSGACRGCHPSEHASWSRTWHRTMTQDATTRTVLAPLDGEHLDARDDVVYVKMKDGDRRVVLTTGSHREQTYWYADKSDELALTPFVWLVREKRFVPRRDAFLTPPDREVPSPRWNSSCIACHAVAGEPGRDKRSFDTRAAELGVACEACHGPGASHVERHRDPVERYMQHASKRADPTIVHPRRLPPSLSAAVCGQCHAYAFPRDESQWWTTGYALSFRAGDDLGRSRMILDPDTLEQPGAPQLDAEARSPFWPDGSIRVGGREYNGMIQSPCWRGEGERKITCLSCHSMHSGDPAGQIDPKKSGCAGCHTMTSEHSHHAPGSPGAECVACHMPKTSYALFSAVRSHRIEKPSAELTAETGKPNACNLCHLDKTLAWTAARLTEWYGTKPVQDARDEVSEGMFEALTGDAAMRVVVADALGKRGDPWQAAILAELVADPYAAVRFVAARSLRAQPGFEDLAIDFPGDGDAARRSVLARIRPDAVDPGLVHALLSTRDDRAVTIAE
jgi:hypothetical protein